MKSSNLDLNNLSVIGKNAEKAPSHDHLILIDKPSGKTSFDLVAGLRRVSNVKKVGHAGTLDPFATGVMLLLVGSSYTRLSSAFIGQDKQYLATVHLGIATDTYDCDGKVVKEQSHIPSLHEVTQALNAFQGTILQIPPMFSAKKQQGKKLYELARKGIEVAREKIEVTLNTELLFFKYPKIQLRVSCSKGTYIRAIANDLGEILGCGAHLSHLTRTRCGPFLLEDCIPYERALGLYPFLGKPMKELVQRHS